MPVPMPYFVPMPVTMPAMPITMRPIPTPAPTDSATALAIPAISTPRLVEYLSISVVTRNQP